VEGYDVVPSVHAGRVVEGEEGGGGNGGKVVGRRGKEGDRGGEGEERWDYRRGRGEEDGRHFLPPPH